MHGREILGCRAAPYPRCLLHASASVLRRKGAVPAGVVEKDLPIGVRRDLAPRDLLPHDSKTRRPNPSSSFLICKDTVDCVRPTRSAARVKPPLSAMATRCAGDQDRRVEEDVGIVNQGCCSGAASSLLLQMSRIDLEQFAVAWNREV
jgi:hypothetical protein